MKSPIEILEDALHFVGGYILIPEEYRETFELSDGCGYNKTTKIKSIISVCESWTSTGEDIIRVKVLDEDDAMWDAEEYMTTDSLKDLVIICGKIDNKLIK